MGYPEPIETSSIESISSWTYNDLYNAYQDPNTDEETKNLIKRKGVLMKL